MGTSASPIATFSDRPTLHRRLELLERRCTELWADEPRSCVNREAALARLADLEHRIVGLVLKRVAHPDEHDLDAAVDCCERDLADLAALWAAPRAA